MAGQEAAKRKVLEEVKQRAGQMAQTRRGRAWGRPVALRRGRRTSVRDVPSKQLRGMSLQGREKLWFLIHAGKSRAGLASGEGGAEGVRQCHKS